MKRKKILGGKSNSCPMCGGTVVYIYVKRIGVVSQCTTCNSCISGRVKDDIYIYSFTGGDK